MMTRTVVERKVGGIRSLGAHFYRWSCSCGDTGRWTRQIDTARTGRKNHADTHNDEES